MLAAATAPAPALAAPRDTHDVLRVFVDTPRGSAVDFLFAAQTGARPVPLARSLAVFTMLPRATDALPALLRHVFPASPDLTPEPNRSRLLAASGSKQVFAFPTRQGGVCYFLYPLGGGGCTQSLDDGALPQVERGVVWGVIDNAARQVDVRLSRSRSIRAHRGRNGFLLQLPDGVRAPRQILISERDGSKHVYTIKRCRLKDISPLTGANPLAPPPC